MRIVLLCSSLVLPPPVPGDPRAPVEPQAVTGTEQPAPPMSPGVPSGAEASGEREVAGPGPVAPEPPAPSDAGPPTAEGPVDDGYDPLRDSPQALRNRHFVVTGAVLLTVGVVLGAGALAMGLSDPCDRKAGNSCVEQARDRAAWTMGAPAIAMTAGGIAALTVGLVRQHRLRAGIGLGAGEVAASVSLRF